MRRSALAAATLSVAAAASGLALTTATSVAASSLPTMTITMTPKAITVRGAEVSGAVDITTTVRGESSDSPTMVRLKPGVTLTEFANALAKLGDNTPLDSLDPYATIVYSDAVIAERKPTSIQATLAPGTYVVAGDGIATRCSPSAHPPHRQVCRSPQRPSPRSTSHIADRRHCTKASSYGSRTTDT